MCTHGTGERNSARRGVPLVYSPEHAEVTRGTDLQCGPPRVIFFLSFVLTKRSGWEGEMKEVTRLGAVPSRIGNRGRLRKRGVDFFNKLSRESMREALAINKISKPISHILERSLVKLS